MQREFVYTEQFERAWQKLGFTDDDLIELERKLLKNPQLGDVVPETGGLRKFRIPANGREKEEVHESHMLTLYLPKRFTSSPLMRKT